METSLVVGLGDKQANSEVKAKRQSKKFFGTGFGVNYSSKVAKEVSSKIEQIDKLFETNNRDIVATAFEAPRKGIIAAYELSTNNKHAGIFIIEDMTDNFYDDKRTRLKHDSVRLKVTFVANATKKQYLETPSVIMPDYLTDAVYKNSVDILYLNKSSHNRPAELKNFIELAPEVFEEPKTVFLFGAIKISTTKDYKLN